MAKTRTAKPKHAPTSPQIVEPASLARRLAAMVYDSLITMTVAMTYGAAFLAIKYRFIAEPLAEGQRASMGTVGFIGLIVTLMLFYSFFWHRGGQSIGMRAWRLQIIQPNGQYPSWPQCLLRSLLAPLSLAAAGIGYFWCLFDAEGQTLHDRLSNTRTIKLPKATKNTAKKS